LKFIFANEGSVNFNRNLLAKYKEVKMSREPQLNYLGMVLDYSTPQEVSISMPSYVQDLLKDAVPGIAKTPAGNDLYEVGVMIVKLCIPQTSGNTIQNCPSRPS